MTDGGDNAGLKSEQVSAAERDESGKVDTEELTEGERALLVAYARWAGQGDGVSSGSAAAKLLRIHDRLQAERRELRQYVRTQDAMMTVRVGELEAYNLKLREQLDYAEQCALERGERD